MLKTVVRDDDVDAGMLSKELKPRLHAFAADRHGSKRLACDEERLVSYLSGIGIGRHEADAVFRAPEPARDDAGGPPAGAERPHERDRHGGLPRSAHVDVPDDHDRHREVVRYRSAAARSAYRLVDERERIKETGDRAPMGPDAVHPGFKPGMVAHWRHALEKRNEEWKPVIPVPESAADLRGGLSSDI